MRIAIAAGGTGGHFYPGLAVAKELQRSGESFFFIIKKGDYVRPLLDREKIPYHLISAAGFQRKFSPKIFVGVFNLVAGFFQSIKILRSEKPAALLVMGGYLSAPPALAAHLLGIPVVLHEQNVIPGLANRFIRHFVRKVAISFPGSAKFDTKAVLTGNPIRAEFSNLPTKAEARKKWGLEFDKFTLLVFGGSLGAQKLNNLVLSAFEQMDPVNLQVIHIAGPLDVISVRDRYERLPFKSYVDSYCHDMPAAYAACDWVVCRAGASTISELMVVKKPSILVPYPLATDDHQTANARVLADVGAALLHQQKELTVENLRDIFEKLIAGTMRIGSEGFQRLPIDPALASQKIAALIREVAA